MTDKDVGVKDGKASDGDAAAESDEGYCAENEGILTPLSPVELPNDDFRPYEHQLEFALENSSVRNVAIAGAYASGKSSLIKTLISKDGAKDKRRKFISLSLAHFPNEGQDTAAVSFERQLEAHLIGQLSRRVEAKAAPRSPFLPRRDIGRRKLIVWSIAVPLIIATVMASALWAGFPDALGDHPMRMSGLAAIYLVCAGIVVFQYLKYRPLRGVVRKLKIGSGEVELFGEGDSLLDRYLDEVVYLIDASGADVVVLEDIDRFGSSAIFERLRAINEIVNNDKRIGKPERTSPVKFFYLVKDDLFSQESRRKFFDFIIPIIPFVGPSNAFGLLCSKLNGAGLFPDAAFLAQLSFFVPDSRALFDIVNESICFRDACFGVGARLEADDATRLVALLAYKVSFPRDFAALQVRKGYLCGLVTKASDVRYQTWDFLGKEIDSLSSQESFSSEEEIDAVASRIMSLRADRELVYERSFSVALNYYPKAKVKEANDDFFVLEDDPACLIDAHSMLSDSGFPLVRFLVTNGYVDASYPRYVSDLKGAPLQSSDNDFLTNALQGGPARCGQRISNPARVLSMLDSSQFMLTGLRNYDILRTALDDDSPCLDKLFARVVVDEDWGFVFGFVLSESYSTKIYGALWEHWPMFYGKPVRSDKPDSDKRRYVQRVLSDAGDLLPEGERKVLVSFAMEDKDFAHIEPGIDGRSLCEGLAGSEFKLVECNEASADTAVLAFLFENDMFRHSAGMYVLLLKSLKGVTEEELRSRGLVSLLHGKLLGEPFEDGLLESLSDLLEEVLKEGYPYSPSNSDPVGWVLGNISGDGSLGEKYIDSLTGEKEVSDLAEIENSSYWEGLMAGGHVVPSIWNVVVYYGKYEMDECLASMLWSADVALCLDAGILDEAFEQVTGDRDCTEFMTDLINVGGRDAGRYKELVGSFGRGLENVTLDDVDEWQAFILIDTGVVVASKENIRGIRRRFGDESAVEARLIKADGMRYAQSVDSENANLSRRTAVCPSKALIVSAFAAGVLDPEAESALIGTLGVVNWDRKFRPSTATLLLNEHFDEEDVESLDDIYGSYEDREVRQAVADRLIQSSDLVIRRDVQLGLPLLHAAMRVENGSLEVKLELIEHCGHKTSIDRSNYIKLFEEAGVDELPAVLRGNIGKAVVPRSPAMGELLLTLQINKFISSYKEYGSTQYRVNAKRVFED